MKKVLIIDTIHPNLIDNLQKCGWHTIYTPNITREEIKNQIAQYHALVVRSKTLIDREILSIAKNLKIIARYGAGIEGIDINYCKQKGIKVLNAPEGNRNAVAEHTLGLLLALTNKICKSAQEVKNGIWNRNANWGNELEGKTVGIIGYGNTGSTFAKKLIGFDVNIIAYDKYKTNFGNNYVKEVDLTTIFNYTDILSLHIPLTEETNQMANISFFNKFKKPIIFLNTSRGQIVNTKNLITAIENKQIIAAGLDVLEYEKNTFEELFSSQNETLDKLLKLENVIITPHIAGWSNQSFLKMAQILSSKICNTKF